MRRAPIAPAQIEWDSHGIPFSPAYADIYHPHAGALAQARHVFLGGNELPQRWRGRDHFTILETGFGLGNNFLATWDAWRHDPDRCAHLSFVSIEQHPLTREALGAIARDAALGDLAAALLAAWPPLTPDLHRLSFDDGRVELLLALGDVQAWLPELAVTVDAFFLDGFAPARNPRMWDAAVLKALGRLAAPGSTLATWTAAQAVRAGLVTAGFDVRLGAGTGGKRDITLACFRPPFVPKTLPARPPLPAAAERRALIVGGGLAGASSAWALAERGWRSTLLERGATLAAEASGNPAGLFHGTVHAQDGPHARFNRAAAFAVTQAVRTAISAHGVAGALDGLLRLETRLAPEAMRALLGALGLPPQHVIALDAAAAAALAGISLPAAAWHYPGGGWVDPAGLVRSYVERAGRQVEVRTGVEVEAIRLHAGRWQALDAHGTPIDDAGTLILANAGDALRLLGAPAWTLEQIRGQISVMADPPAPLDACRLPVVGRGYLIPLPERRCVFGATSQPGDGDPSVRHSDQADNLTRLARLVDTALDIDPASLSGRTAWRWATADRLPVIGAVPARSVLRGERASLPRWDRPRFVPREPGLFVFTALGSRGITWSALGAQILAASVAGTAVGIEASLIDAIDPARFISRAKRQEARFATPAADAPKRWSKV